MKQFFQDYYKKFILILLLIPMVLLVDKMEFPKIDAFIRDALQYLNSTDGVTKDIVTVNIDTDSGEFKKPLNFESISKALEKVKKSSPKYIVLFLEKNEISSDPTDKNKIFSYLEKNVNVYLNVETSNNSLFSDELFKKFPRYIEFDFTKDVSVSAKDRKHRRAMISYNKRGKSQAYSSLETLGLSYKSPESYTNTYDLFESRQAFIRSFPLGTFGNYQLTSINETDNRLKNKVLLIGSFDEWSPLSTPSIFDFFGKGKVGNFNELFYPYQDSIANLINLYVTGNYVKFLSAFYDLNYLFILLILILFLPNSTKNKIYLFFAIIPTIILLIVTLYLVTGVYIDFSRSIALLLLLQYIAIPIIMFGIFREQEKRKLEETNKARIDSLLLVSEKVAHDIRSPLSAINLILSRLQIDEPEYKKILYNSIKRIDDIAAKTLTKYKTNLGVNYEKYEFFDALTSIDKIVEEKKFLNENVVYNLNFSSSSKQVFGHEMEFERVLSNLIDNSLFALKNNPNPIIAIKFTTTKAYLEIELKDNGTGIDQKILNVLGSERVSTKNNDLVGSGIALIHAKRAIEKMGGSMRINSKEGQGTTITLCLKF
jgi:signal transduction histidine kinase